MIKSVNYVLCVYQKMPRLVEGRLSVRQYQAVIDHIHDHRKLYLTNGTWSSVPESSTQFISSLKDLIYAGRRSSVTVSTASLTLATHINI